MRHERAGGGSRAKGLDEPFQYLIRFGACGGVSNRPAYAVSNRATPLAVPAK
jgi:hypothetical protein